MKLLKIILVNILIIAVLISISIFFMHIYALRNDYRKCMSPIFLRNPSGCDNLRHILKPNSASYMAGVEYKINSLGFRDREYDISKPHGVYRILCVGDSLTFGEGVPTSNTYPKILEQQLQKLYGEGNIEVINTGVSGYNTFDEYWYIKHKLLRLNPDMIIVGFYIGNDPEDPSIAFNTKMLLSDGEYKGKPALVRYFNNKRNRRRLNEDNYWDEYMRSIWAAEGAQWKRCVKSLEDIRRITEENNIKLFLLVFPGLETNPASKISYHLQLFDVLQRYNIDYVDALGKMEEIKLFYQPANKEDPHPYANIHKIYAAAALDFIKQERFIKGKYNEEDGSK